MKKPTIFIGSSTEGGPIAYAIQENLETVGDVYVWTQGVFDLGSSYLESLIKELDKADFAILVLTEDDITKSRNEETVSPRDNVLFELGLFMGRLGRNRSYFVYDRDKKIKIPSDLSGIGGASYTLQQSGNLTASLGAACNKIRSAVINAGIRTKMDPAHITAYEKRLDFCTKVSGNWWERIKPDAFSAISFVEIMYDEALLMLNLKGKSFDRQGIHIAYWESKSTSINFIENKVYYHWKGWFPSNPAEPFEGVGEIDFSGLQNIFTEANGIFSNMSIANIKSIEKKSFELSRSTEGEIEIMNSKDKEIITKLIADKIGRMS